ncbi:Imm61 family immunity protein [Mycolicibacterium sp. P1-5]|uniref:Imm61 family immunity protein n=1 Tax=Mycolicibacterium sp. P1-5 TaxID=2024617 RepID=UPI0011F07B67|nr:Imm61 family immunity protein [Mycolicibacterium sp. P1-5]KAA0104697.1 hypothetical protein CIW47_21230 [Mycolicibacterium sp. P1-5]
MTTQTLPDDLISWGRRAGMAYSESESTSAAIFFNGGGEFRYFVRRSVDEPGWFTVTKASRSDPERFLFSAKDLALVEKYFWATFGADIRSVQRQPFLAFPTEPDELSDGYTLQRPSAGVLLLVNPSGQAIIKTRDGVVYEALLVMMSYWLESSVEDLKTAFLDPSGRPVFPMKPPTN